MPNEDKYKKFLESNYELLERFREIAPGTYKHCQNVSNICEAIALELTLNPDFMKVIGMYHDIGKIFFPLHFSENQPGNQNIHDDIVPSFSYHLITRHVGDGILLLLQNDFPIDVIKAISEHHGDMILRQFHAKDSKTPEDNYRYKCMKPSSTESVILMLVDTVEASTRSRILNSEKNSEDIADTVREIVSESVERLDQDDQLDSILHGTIKIAKRILVRELESVYHKRVSYPKKSES